MTRLDVELVVRGLAPSRTRAQRLVEAGRVHLNGEPISRTSQSVASTDSLLIAPAPGEEYVSRAGHKLAGALDALAASPAGAPVIAGRRVLDAGASTGGFTDVVLRRGAAHVVAVDVGSDQLDSTLRGHPKITLLERVNVRDLQPEQVAPSPDVLVADLSFISLTLVLDPLARCVADAADALVLIKPQFEVGRERLGSGGIVNDARARRQAIIDVLTAAGAAGWRTRALLPSSLPGTHGNLEFVAWLRRSSQRVTSEPEILQLADQVTAGELVLADWSTS